MSGSPVVDEQRQVVIGMIAKGKNKGGKDESQRNLLTTFATSMEVIREVCPKISYSLNTAGARVGDWPVSFDGAVQNFLEYYLGTPERSSPFGGRDADLYELNAWLLHSDSPPYALLVAPAGRGKSALLAHWITELKRDPVAPFVLYFPISARFNTNRESVVFSALYTFLARFHEEPIIHASETQEYRRLVVDYLRRPTPKGRPILVVLDGLDEAADWKISAEIFPTEPPPHLRVLVAARELAGNVDWLLQLGWERAGKTKIFHLAKLDQDAVRDVLLKRGISLDQKKIRFDVAAKLYELSSGDPLLLGLYIDSLWPRKMVPGEISLNDLLLTKPGITPYFDLWFRQQDAIWHSTQAQVDRSSIDVIFGICSTAFGPLTKADLVSLLPDVTWTSGKLERTINTVSRFVLGDGTEERGYIFSHPFLKEYFLNKLSHKERTEWENRFLSYGRETLSRLQDTSQIGQSISRYIVKYFSAHLLAQDKIPASDFYSLISESWLYAWQLVDGTVDGFLDDVFRAWVIADGEGPAAIDKVIRSALCFSSTISLSSNVPNELIVTCLKLGVISNSEAISIAGHKSDLGERAICLALISDYLPAEDKKAILTIALENITIVENNHRNIDRHLEEIVEHIPPEFQELLVQCLFLARKIGYLRFRVRTLCSLSEKIPQQTIEILTEAITVTLAIEDERDRALALEIPARKIPITAPELIDIILNSLKSIQNEDDRDGILLAIVQVSSQNSHDLISRVLDEISLFEEASSYDYGNIIRSIADRLSEEDQSVWERLILISQRSDDFTYILNHMPRQFSSLWLSALVIIRSMQDNYEIIRAMKIVTPNLPADDRNLWLDLLSSTLLIEDETDRLQLFKTLVKSLPISMRELWVSALNTVEQFTDSWSYAGALIALIEYLPSEFHDLWGKLLDLGYSFTTQTYSHRVFVAIAEYLPLTESNFLTNLLNIIGTREDKALLLATVANRFPSKEKKAQTISEALQVAHSIESELSRVSELSSLLEYLPLIEQRSVLAETMPIICDTSEAYWVYVLLERILKFLPVDMSDEWNMAVVAVGNMNDERYRVLSLLELIKYLPSQREDLFFQVVTLVKGMNDLQDRGTALCKLIEKLPTHSHSLHKNILAIVNSMDDGKIGLDVICVLASHVSGEDREVWYQLVTAVEKLIAEKTVNSWYYVDTLDTVAKYLPAAWPELWMKILGLASQLATSDRSRFLSNVVEKLPGAPDLLWAQILDLAYEIEYPRDRSLVLHAIAQHLPSNLNYLYHNALARSYEINDTDFRTQTLLTFANYLSKESAHLVMAELLASVNLIRDEKTHLAVIQSAAKNLSIDYPRYSYEDLLLSARLLNNEIYRVDALMAIVPYLPERVSHPLLKESLEYSRTIKYEDSKVKAMLAILLHFSGDEQKNILLEAIRIARTEQYPNIKILLLIKVVETWKAIPRPFWNISVKRALKVLSNKDGMPSRRSLLIEAITSLQSIENDTSFNITLRDLCLCLRSVAPDLLQTALRDIQKTDSKKRRAYGLAIVADYLPVDQQLAVLTEALTIAQTIEDNTARVYVLRTIASSLPISQRHTVLVEALDLAKNIQDDSMRASALQTVIRQASPEDHELFLMGLSIARSIEPKYYRVAALATVAKNLLLDQRINILDESLFISQSIQDEWERCQSILKVAEALPASATELQQEVLRAVYSFDLNHEYEMDKVIDILEALVPHWIEMFEGDTKVASNAISTVLKTFSKKKRSTLLKILAVFAPVIYKIGGEKTVLASAQSILDTSRWWV
ncbi:MAG: ATP-binding protein [Anaerolineales bacterium]|nr:ATP-binding protein [Anaerolineales bacterium]